MYSYIGDRSFQQGGIAAFLIVALVLAGVVGGGLSLVKWRTEQAALTQTAASADTPQEQTPRQDDAGKAPVAEENGAPSEQAEQTPQERQDPAEERPVTPETPAPATPPQVAADQATRQPEVPATGSSAAEEVVGIDDASGTTGTGAIAATGPAETLGAMFALGALTVFGLTYARSGKRLTR